MRLGLAAAFFLALVLRLMAVLLWPIPPAKDAAEYEALGRRLAAGQGYTLADGTRTAFRPPGLPALIALVYRVAGAEPMAARLALALIGAAGVVAVAACARVIAGKGAALTAAFLAAVYPPFVSSWFSPRALLAEVLLTSLTVAALALALEAGDAASEASRRKLAAASGLLAGLACLAKGTVLLLLPLLCGYLLVRTRRIGTALLAPLVALLALLPWAVRNQLALGHPVLVSTNGGISVWASYNPASRGLGNAEEGYAQALAEDVLLRAHGMGEVERSRHFLARARAEVLARPHRALRLVLRKALLFFDPTLKDWSREEPPLAYNIGYGAVLPLAALGAIGLNRRRPRPAAAILLLVFAFLLAGLHVLLHTDVRYRVALEPVLLVFAALFAVDVGRRLGTGRTAALACAYLLVHLGIAWRYDAVFAGLRGVTAALGLG